MYVTTGMLLHSDHLHELVIMTPIEILTCNYTGMLLHSDHLHEHVMTPIEILKAHN